MMQTISQNKYTSRNRNNKFACFIELLYSSNPHGYHWQVWSCVNDEPGEIVRQSDDLDEDEASSARWAESNAEQYLGQLQIDDPGQIARWWGDRPSTDVIIPRETLEAMPGEWQGRFIELMQELEHEPATEDIQPKYFQVSGGEIMRFIKQ
jgi:hypothetical protein